MAIEPPTYTKTQFQEDLATGFFGTIAIARRVRWLLALWLVAGVLASILHAAGSPTVSTVLGLPIAVMASYALAGAMFGIVLFLTRPLRRWFIGWLVSGYLLAAVVYGSVGFVSVVVYIWFGLKMVEYTSSQEAWQSLPEAMGALGFVGVIAGAITYFQYKKLAPR
jgi:hypothetical protein